MSVSQLPLVDARQSADYAHFIDLHFSASQLIKLDMGSKSDPFVVVSQRQQGGQWHEIARTDTVWDSHDCTFGNVVNCRFHLSNLTFVKLEVWDRENANEQLTDHDFIGLCHTDSSALMQCAQTGDALTFQLLHPKRPLRQDGASPSGMLHVVADKRMWRTRDGLLTLRIGAVLAPEVSKVPTLQVEVQREHSRKEAAFVSVFRSEPLIGSVLHKEKGQHYRVSYKNFSLKHDLLSNANVANAADNMTPLRLVVYVVESMRYRHLVSRPIGWIDTSFAKLRRGELSAACSLQTDDQGLRCGALDIAAVKKRGFPDATQLQLRVLDVAIEV